MSAIPDYNFAVAADIQTGIQILLYPSLLLAYSRISLVILPVLDPKYLICTGLTITIILIIVKEVLGERHILLHLFGLLW